MVAGRGRKHDFCFGQLVGRQLFEAVYHLLGIERGRLAVDDERERQVGVRKTIVVCLHAGNLAQCLVGVVGGQLLEQAGHVEGERALFESCHGIAAFHHGLGQVFQLDCCAVVSLRHLCLGRTCCHECDKKR